MKKPAKEKHFVKKPKYPGGKEALRAFIKKEMKYPKAALENKIQGVVRVRYTINAKGKVIKTKVLHHLSHGCSEEAERLVKLLKFDVPKNHLKVTFHKHLDIRFKLPKKKKKKQVQFVYQTKTKSKPKVEKTTSYNYTITI